MISPGAGWEKIDTTALEAEGAQLLAQWHAGRLQPDLHGLREAIYAEAPVDNMAMQFPALFAMRWRGFQDAQREAATLSPTDAEAVQAFLLRHFGSEARPHVLAALVDLLPIPGATFWELVVRGWEMFDAIPHARYAALFATHTATRPAEIGSTADRAFHVALPDPVTLYRGQSGRAALGLSWTTDKAVAESFAQGHRGITVPAPAVFTLAAKRQEIAFCCAERGESEVVLMAIPAKRRARKL